MSYELYDLASLESRLAEEFGLDLGDSAVKSRVDNIINDAISHLVGAFPRWSWLRKTFTIDVKAKKTGKGDVTQGSTTISSLSSWSSDPALRDIIVDGSGATTPTSGYLVTAVSGSPVTSLTIETQYLGSTATGKDLSAVSGWFQLPADLIVIEELEMRDGLGLNHLNYVPPAIMEKMRWQARSVPNADRFYTILNDPLGTSANRFLLIYPYLETPMTIRGVYVYQPAKLVNGSDEPPMPPYQRVALLRIAEWLMAEHLRLQDQKVAFYRDRAGLASASARNFDAMSNEVPSEVSPFSEDIDFIQGPPGYPRFTD